MNRQAVSLVEIMIALVIAVVVFVPVAGVMSSSGQQVTKGRNYSFAAGLGRYISQKLYITPYDDIQDVGPCSPCDSVSNNPYFVPFANTGSTKSSQTGITKEAFPGLYSFLVNNDFKYSLSVGSVFYTNDDGGQGGMADGAKSVSILITWNEGGRPMIYRTHVYVTSL